MAAITSGPSAGAGVGSDRWVSSSMEGRRRLAAAPLVSSFSCGAFDGASSGAVGSSCPRRVFSLSEMSRIARIK